MFTLEGLVSQMRPNMLVQVPVLTETLFAVFTFVWFFPRVYAKVHLEMVASTEALTAVFTPVRLVA